MLPREVGSRNAWLSVISPTPSPPASVEVRGAPVPVPVLGNWTGVPDGFGTSFAWQQRVELTGLNPGSPYQLVLAEAGVPVAECRLSTLPEALPTVASPLTMLTASCFSVMRDTTGALGRAFLRLPSAFQPQIAVLTGDQVYLDTPISHFLFRFHSPFQLAAEFASNYGLTWGQRAPDGGFGALASNVGSFLTGDDHELWNNAPNVAPHLPDTWTQIGRQTWTTLAEQLFKAYQTPHRVHAIELPPLSIRIVDTRFSRSADRDHFMDPNTMAEVTTWLQALTGPAILALGQPILAPRTGLRGYFSDWTLPDYRQYEDLVRALSATAHDIVIVTGDVHFARVAEVRLPNGRRLVEIIASPMALVDDHAGRKWKAPPQSFPAFPVPGVVSAPVTVGALQTFANHFATLALWAEGGSVRLDHTAWLVGADGSLPQPMAGFSGRLN
jgi:hypothetical protein